MQRARKRLSYANLMSTAAVFLAIGGTAWAVAKIDGSDIQKQSIPGNRLEDNTVTGKQVKESKLGEVPSAASATNAATADSATHAANADNATNAANAETLNGFHDFDFEKATVVLDGQGQSNSTNPQALFNALGVGATLTTDGDSDNNSQILLHNNNAANNIIGTVFTQTGPPTSFGVLAGTSQQIGPTTGTGTDSFDTLITDATGPASRSMWIHCFFQISGGVPMVYCWGIST